MSMPSTAWVLCSLAALLVDGVQCLTLSSVNPYNAATSFGTSVTISGLDFGTSNPTPTTAVGSGTQCSTTSWSSATTVSCKAQTGDVGVRKDLIFRSAAGVYSSGNSFRFSFDAPGVSGLSPTFNSAFSGGNTVTILGLNFGSKDPSATGMIAAKCRCTSWVTSTTIRCELAAPTFARDVYTLVSVGGQDGTQTSMFSFDSPVVTSNNAFNGPTSGAAPVSIFGVNFAPVDFTPTAEIGGRLCRTTSWVTNSRLQCQSPPWYGKAQRVIVTISDAAGTHQSGFSYSTPLASFQYPSNAPPIQDSATITIFGLNFGPTATSPIGFIGGEQCETTAWTTQTTVACEAPRKGTRGNEIVGVGGTALGASGTGSVFTYDGPIITSALSQNLPSSTGSTVTISGLNFGYVDATPEAYVGSEYCQTTSWTSITTASCQAPQKVGGQKSVMFGRVTDTFSFYKYYGTMLNVFSFDAPTVSFLVTLNGATSGGTSLTVNGFNFGQRNYSATTSIAETSCSTTSWRSDTAVMCFNANGVGKKQSIYVSVGALVGTLRSPFTFDAPVLTQLNPGNGPLSSGWSMTIMGTSFGAANMSPTAQLGFSVCQSTQWNSDTSLVCRTPTGVGVETTSTATLGVIVGTRPQSFSFDAPVVTFFIPANAASTVGASITLIGINFGGLDNTPSARITVTACTSTSWISSSYLRCGAEANGYGASRKFLVTLGVVVGTSDGIFSFNAPVISQLAATNLPTTKGASLTLNGINFGGSMFTPSAIIGSSQCVTTSWVSTSSVFCASSGGSGMKQSVRVAVGTIGTLQDLFTFDAPALSAMHRPNAAISGGGWVTLDGVNFAPTTLTVTVKIGSSSCFSATWMSATSVSCYARAGLGAQTAVMISVGDAVGTNEDSFSYDAPVLTYIQRFNGITTSKASITVYGLNFGSVDTSGTVRLGSTVCASTMFTSNTAVTCLSPTGFGKTKFLALTISHIASTAPASPQGLIFSFDAPLISHVLPKNIATSGQSSVTLIGTNFASSAVTPSTRIGDTMCISTSWASATMLRCSSAQTVGRSYKGYVTIGEIVGSVSSTFSFDAPTISRLLAVNAPTSTDSVISLHGVNFGSYDESASVRVGSTQCGTATWVSATQLKCGATSSGAGPATSVIVTVGTQVGTAGLMFSFDAPLISLFGGNAPTSGKLYLTVRGENFGGANHTPSVALGPTLCRSVAWTTFTSVLCDLPTAAGTMRSVGVTVGQIVGTTTEKFTFDAPVLSELQRANAPLSSGASITLTGFNFGGIDQTATTVLGKTACVTVSWTSTSSLHCLSPQGVGTRLASVVSLSEVVGCRLQVFTYDGPVVSYILETTSTASTTLVTVTGKNFGSSSLSATSRLGPTECLSSMWSTDTSIVCYASGYGGSVTVQMTISALVGTSGATLFTFSGPMITDVSPANAPTTRGMSVSFQGTNFGSIDLTPTTSIGVSFAGTTSWTSYTTVRVMPSGVGYNKAAYITLSGQLGCLMTVFSFDAPVVTALSQPNAPTSSDNTGATVTIAGTNFGSASSTASAGLGGQMCTTTGFVSQTSLKCLPAQASTDALRLHAVVTVANILGTLGSSFTYNAPTVSMLDPLNSPTCGGGSITIHGSNFAIYNLTPTVFFGSTRCTTMSWTSNSAIRCSPAPTYYMMLHTVRLLDKFGTGATSFSFDSPVLSAITRNGPSAGSNTLTLTGLNFASSNPTATIAISSSPCQSVSWMTTTTMICAVPAGSDEGYTVTAVIGGAFGTLTSVFSYDAAVVTFSLPYNSPTSGSSSITLRGTNFGSSNPTGSVNLGLTICKTASWLTSTSVMCNSPPGHGDAIAISAISAFAGTQLEAFSYDAGVMTHVYSMNSPTSGGTSLTLTGVNFGPGDRSNTVRIGVTDCAETSFVSSTSIVCRSEPGMTDNPHQFLVSSYISTRSGLFSYDVPVVSDLQRPNTPSSGLSSTTLVGVNFGAAHYSASAHIGYTSCITVMWTTSSVLQCRMSSGSGSGFGATVTMASLIGTKVRSFSWDAPTVSFLDSYNAPTSGGASVTMLGASFATADPSATGKLNAVICATSSWTSVSLVRCTLGASYGDSITASISIDTLIGTAYEYFSFDAPVVSHMQSESPTILVGYNTVYGTNFGSSNPTPTVSVGNTQCTSVGWLTSTSIFCESASGSGSASDVSVTLGSSSGATSGLFSFSGPTVTYAYSQNLVVSGGSSLTLVGYNFGVSDLTVSSRLGNTVCGTASWVSYTNVMCMPGVGSTARAATVAVVTVSDSIGSALSLFSFDAPVVSHLAPSNTPHTGGSSLTLRGVNFYISNSSPTLSLGSSICGTTSWVSQTQARCAPLTGQGLALRIVMDLGYGTNTLTSAFSFDSPVISYVMHQNTPATGAASITLHGINFGLYSDTASPTVKLGDTNCKTSSWASVSSVRCATPAGVGAGLASSVLMQTTGGTMLLSMTFDAPIVSYVSVPNGPMSGGSTVSIAGSNFGQSNPTASVGLGNTACLTSSWVSASILTCLSPIADGPVTIRTAARIAAQTGTLRSAFTYDDPVSGYSGDSGSVKFNLPTTGDSQLTILGSNFGGSNLTPSVRIGTTICRTTSWNTASVITCITPEGSGVAVAMALTLAGVGSVTNSLLSYDAAVITDIDAVNGPASLGQSITLHGLNFASTDVSPTGELGFNVCATTSWASGTSLACKLDASSTVTGFNHLAVTVADAVSTTISLFSFDAPAVTRLIARNAAPSGTASITLMGANFGSQDYSMSAWIGDTYCHTASWVASSMMRCLVVSGVAGSHTLRIVGENRMSATIVGGFSYDAPLLSHSAPFNGALTAAATLTLSGANFLSTDPSVTVQVGETPCSTSTWMSQTSLLCNMQQGSGRRQRVAVTIQSAIGCKERSFSFDAPTIVSIVPTSANGAGTGGATLTIQGNNFGTASSSVTVSVGPTACTTSAWISNTAMRCTTPAGAGTHEIRVEISSQIGTALRAFSFDSNVLTAASVTNAPVSGGEALILYGIGFGSANLSPSVRLGSTSCYSVTWHSISSVQCSPAPGIGGSLSVTTTIDGLTSAQPDYFSYDAPVISFFNPASSNGPLSGGTSLSIFGSNFGTAYGLGAIGTIGQTSCDVNWWVTDSTLVCKTPGPGVGSSHMMSVQLSGAIGTQLGAFTYNSPYITAPVNANAPSSGGIRVTVNGGEFGVINLTPTARVGRTRCTTSSWVSSTTIRCDMPPGVGRSLHMGASLFDHQATEALVGTILDVFTYDAPTITTMHSANAVVTGSSIVTLSGTNFGSSDHCSSARLGSTSCAKTSFVSNTVMRCLTPAADGLNIGASLTVSQNIGSSESVFSFDTPVLTGLSQPNLPGTMGGYVTLLGVNFGLVDLSASASVTRLESTLPHFCSTASWLSSTSLTCGYGSVSTESINYASMTDATVYQAQIGTFAALFSFDAPVVSSSTPANIPPSGGGTFSLFGTNFITRDLSPSVRIGSTACATSSWMSISSVLCRTEAGTGAYHSAVLTIADRVGSLPSAFSYNGAYDLNTPSPTFSTVVTPAPSTSPTALPSAAPTANYCSGTTQLTALSGTITDGGGAGPYASNSDCKWLISTPGLQMGITLTFNEFDVETSYDLLKVYDGLSESFPLLASLSGSDLPQSIIASSGAMYIVFTSDASMQGQGFSVSWSTSALIFSPVPTLTPSYGAGTPTPVQSQGTPVPTASPILGSLTFSPTGVPCSGYEVLTSPTGTLSDGSGGAGYQANANCEWRIDSGSAGAISLSFSSFNLEGGYDFIKVYAGASSAAPMLRILTGAAIPSTLTTSSSSMYLIFTSDSSVQNTGFSGSYSIGGATFTPTVFSTGSPTSGISSFSPTISPASEVTPTPTPMPTYPTSPASPTPTFLITSAPTSTSSPCFGTVTLTASSGVISDGSGATAQYIANQRCIFIINVDGSITLSFSSFNLEQGYDFVKVYSGLSSSDTLVATLTGSSVPTPVTSTSGGMYIVFNSDSSVQSSGFDASYTSDSSGLVTTPSPLAATPGTTAPAFPIGPAPTPAPVAHCSGSVALTSSSGSISDGSGSGNYNPNSNCIWTISASGEVVLSFDSFDLESGYDYLKVYAGTSTSGNLLAELSGTATPATLRSLYGGMHLVFTSDSSVQGSGFEASFVSSLSGSVATLAPTPALPSSTSAPITSPGGTRCAGSVALTSPSGVLTDGPDNYNANANCVWTISSTGTITLSFSSFNLESGYDYLKVYAGTSSSATQLASLTGTVMPAALTASLAMHIVFASDSSVQGSGFDASFTTSSIIITSMPASFQQQPTGAPLSSGTPSTTVEPCSGAVTLSAATGTFGDGSGPSAQYGPSASCSWTLTASGTITLSFSTFDLEQGYDFVKVYAGTDASSMLASLSGASVPPPISVPSGGMYVTFISDSSVQRGGFTVSYAASSGSLFENPTPSGGTPAPIPSAVQPSGPCSGQVTMAAPSGTLGDGSGASAQYAPSMLCSWVITASGPLSLSFSTFDLEQGYDFVRVYAGSSASGSLLASLSGVSVPPPISVPSGPVFVAFSSDGTVQRGGFVAQYTGSAVSYALNYVEGQDSKNGAQIQNPATSAPSALIVGGIIVLIALLGSIGSILFVKHRKRIDAVSHALVASDAKILPAQPACHRADSTHTSLSQPFGMVEGSAEPWPSPAQLRLARNKGDNKGDTAPKLAWMEVAEDENSKAQTEDDLSPSCVQMYTDFTEISERSIPDIDQNCPSSCAERRIDSFDPHNHLQNVELIRNQRARIQALMSSMGDHLDRSSSVLPKIQKEADGCQLPTQVGNPD